MENRKTGGVNLILYGAPYTGKSYHLNQRYKDSSQITRIYFQSNYTASNFIGFIKPTSFFPLEDEDLEYSFWSRNLNQDLDLKGDHLKEMDYEFYPRHFTKVLVEAWLNPDQMYTFIIENINTANIPAVFGEMFELFERKENGEGKNAIVPSWGLKKYLLSIPAMKEYIKDGLKIPSNLNVVATMTSNAKKAAELDALLKGQWTFEHFPISVEDIPHKNQCIRYNQREIPWGNFVLALNEKLKKYPIGEDKWIGPYVLTPNEVRIGNEYALSWPLFCLWDNMAPFRSSFFHLAVKDRFDLVLLFSQLDVFKLFE